MLRHNVENNSNEPDEVELSRRSFFGRLAVGAVLSIGMPGVVHASKPEKNKPAQSRSAVRIPKKSAHKAAKATGKTSKVSTSKSAGKAKTNQAQFAKSSKASHSAKQKLLKTAHADRRAQQNNRVRDVYTGKNQPVHVASGHAQDHSGRVHSIIRPGQRDPIIHSSQGSMASADQGRFSSHRSLAFQNPHTGDKLSLTYFEKGRYVSDALAEINFLLRDYRTGDVHAIDPGLLDQLYDLKQMLGLSQPFGVISGYRSPLTNARLHAENAGVANNSFHIHGRAVDIRIERFDLRRIHNAAIAMHRGGVGYYPESNFIHLDTGTFRTWSL
ncbi:MAG: DUF882 domain-containing protein [Methylomonas sp.]|jgi:uncharacterized protein YcbK (DUF882 family)|uniref:YcbK family protein n=1 Tax=Methylomonas sp. TaxID=418 RepID=UPI0025D62123|nr:DUF882 domain-containing protein [Methylomonas sp.]MCK9605425.1 DUF882 domain-containing protein [Methylomonas sp.]